MLPKQGQCRHFYGAAVPLCVWTVMFCGMYQHTVINVYVLCGIGTALMSHFGGIQDASDAIHQGAIHFFCKSSSLRYCAGFFHGVGCH